MHVGTVMTCALLTIGTELTRGELVNTNASYLAEALTSLGHEVLEMVTVDDDDERIVETLLRLARYHRTIICTGGLGPTTDDRTSACAARALGVPLVRSENAYAELAKLLSARGRAVSDSNAKQTDFPDGATILSNAVGTAPGFFIQIGAARAFFMPGVPAEMRAMFLTGVMPRLPAPERNMSCIRLRTFGLPESEVNDRLQGIEADHDVTIGYRASHSEIEVKVLATSSADDRKTLDARVRRVANLVRERLLGAVYAEGTTPLPEVLGQLLLENNLTFGVAESCTGGLVSELITRVSGASRYFLGGVCCYANSVKEALLDVPTATLLTHGAVSAQVAQEMAEGARVRLGADVTLALTGIAGPDGGSTEKPVGLVHWAVATPNGTASYQKVFSGTREQIQMRAALFGLWSVREALLCAKNPATK